MFLSYPDRTNTCGSGHCSVQKLEITAVGILAFSEQVIGSMPTFFPTWIYSKRLSSFIRTEPWLLRSFTISNSILFRHKYQKVTSLDTDLVSIISTKPADPDGLNLITPDPEHLPEAGSHWSHQQSDGSWLVLIQVFFRIQIMIDEINVIPN